MKKYVIHDFRKYLFNCFTTMWLHKNKKLFNLTIKVKHLEMFGTYIATNTLVFIRKHKTTEKIPQNMFQSLGDYENYEFRIVLPNESYLYQFDYSEDLTPFK